MLHLLCVHVGQSGDLSSSRAPQFPRGWCGVPGEGRPDTELGRTCKEVERGKEMCPKVTGPLSGDRDLF